MDNSALMAKKRSEKRNPSPQRQEVVAFRCTTEYKVHLEKIAEAETRTTTQVIQRALDAYAKENGYTPFPKR